MGPGSRAAAVLAAASLVACGEAHRVQVSASRSGGACLVCHGGALDETGAPPLDTRGRSDTALPSVGAHRAHVAAGLDCTACHPKPASVVADGHLDGRVDLRFGARATAGGTLDPSFDATTFACANVYCHGAFRGGRAANAPRWTRVGAGEAACGTCHGLPPPRSAGHPQRTACGDCHPGYTSSSVVAETHLDGTVQFGALSCTACHGDSTRAATTLNPRLAAAPPLDVDGETATTARGVGAHQVHLAGSARSAPLACTECHAVPASVRGHPTGAVSFAWGPLATGAAARTTSDGARTVVLTPAAGPGFAGGACTSVYCHGAYSGTYTFPAWDGIEVHTTTVAFAGRAASPAWTGAAPCGSCHLVPPDTGGVWHSGSHAIVIPGANDCGLCHPDATGTSAANGTITDPASHVDGKVDLAPRWQSRCLTCH
jgi:predicted CxxxxCH...CXXCH cytochrome family protein